MRFTAEISGITAPALLEAAISAFSDLVTVWSPPDPAGVSAGRVAIHRVELTELTPAMMNATCYVFAVGLMMEPTSLAYSISELSAVQDKFPLLHWRIEEINQFWFGLSDGQRETARCLWVGHCELLGSAVIDEAVLEQGDELVYKWGSFGNTIFANVLLDRVLPPSSSEGDAHVS